MTGGLLSLAALGEQDAYLTFNPSITFWKAVYRRHTNFAMEGIRDELGVDVEFGSGTRLVRYTIPRHGDLVSAVYLGLALPEVRATGGPLPFRWVRHLGEVLVEEVSMYIGGALIERLYGEWLHIWNELTLGADRRGWYDELIANTPAFYDPTGATIEARTVYVPVPLFFTRNAALALPLVALQYHTVDLDFRLRPSEDLYQLRYARDGGPPDWFRPLPGDPSHRLSKYQVDPNHRSRAFIEINYVFLDDQEREVMARDSHEYLIHQVSRTQFDGLLANNVLDLVLQNPVTQLAWVPFAPAAARVYNDRFAFGARRAGADGPPWGNPIRSCALLFNGMERLQEKDAEYFRFLQPYQHGAAGARRAGQHPPVFLYSFALDSARPAVQPSGSCNMSRIGSVQLVLRLAPGWEPDVGVVVYAVNYNVFKMISGMASVVFAN